MRLNDLGEFSLIERLASKLPPPPESVIAGIGDDCAVLAGDGDLVTLFAADASVEGTHFSIDTPRIGWKTLVSNLSDIAAMGGTPRAALIVLGARPDVEISVVDGIYDELVLAAKHYGVAIVGGDTVATSGPLVLSVSVLGEVPGDQVIMRTGAAIGDALMCVGWLGNALGGHQVYLTRREMWDMSRTVTSHEPKLGYHERLAFVTASLMRSQAPRPRLDDSHATHRLELEFHNPLALIDAGRVLAKTQRVTAMIDVSDGLAGDAIKLGRASEVAFRIDMAKLPVSPDLVACFGEERAPELALRGGEDYALLFTVGQDDVADVTDALMKAGYLAARIGVAIPAIDGHRLILPTGEEEPMQGGSWEHFGR